MYFYAHRERALRCGSLPNFLPSIVLCSHFLFNVSSFFLPFFFELRTYIFLNSSKHASKSTWIHREFFDQENKILMDCFPFLFMDYYWCIIVICWNYNYWRFSKYFNILKIYNLLVWWSLSKKKIIIRKKK